MQELTIKVVFKTEHIPNSEAHLQQVLYNYLKGKGVDYSLRDNMIKVWKQRTYKTLQSRHPSYKKTW